MEDRFLVNDRSEDVNIESSITYIPNDLLRTKICWLAHDLDKTINSTTENNLFKKIGTHEAAGLRAYLDEWMKRKLPNEEVIIWAENVFKEFEIIVSGGKERYNLEFDYNELDPEAVFNVIKTRRSIRRWKNKSIPKELVRKVIEAGQWAPSACNRQSCRYIVLEEKSHKQLIVNLREHWLKDAPILIFVGVDKRNYLLEEINYVPYMDASVAIQNMLLLAHAIGLGAVLCKTAEWDINVARSEKYTNDLSAMYSGLNIPPYFIPVAIIALGYPERYPLEPKRLPYDSVTFYEQYSTEDQVFTFTETRKGIKKKIKYMVIRIIKRVARTFGIQAYLTID